MLRLDGLMGKEEKGGYGWLQRAELRMNPILLPPVLELVELELETLMKIKLEQ